MAWRTLDLTANLLRKRGLDVVAVWTPDEGLTPETVYCRWQKTTTEAQRAEADRFIFAETIHHLDIWERPEGCPW
ncbi:MAG: hypothetical protein BGP11_11020 [Rhodobacterales bacterium 65-51]|nr:MAG: hypothetical protein BGP11_11020 [Rhodobacterales bacterium 65-51]